MDSALLHIEVTVQKPFMVIDIPIVEMHGFYLRRLCHFLNVPRASKCYTYILYTLNLRIDDYLFGLGKGAGRSTRFHLEFAQANKNCTAKLYLPLAPAFFSQIFPIQ